MIYATANADPYIPIRNLSTTHKHYKTYTSLCSTAEDPLETYCNLSTAVDLQHNACGTSDNLSSTIVHPFRPHDNRWAAVQPYKTYDDLPAD